MMQLLLYSESARSEIKIAKNVQSHSSLFWTIPSALTVGAFLSSKNIHTMNITTNAITIVAAMLLTF